jgi:hypothetical protein
LYLVLSKPLPLNGSSQSAAKRYLDKYFESSKKTQEVGYFAITAAVGVEELTPSFDGITFHGIDRNGILLEFLEDSAYSEYTEFGSFDLMEQDKYLPETTRYIEFFLAMQNAKTVYSDRKLITKLMKNFEFAIKYYSWINHFHDPWTLPEKLNLEVLAKGLELRTDSLESFEEEEEYEIDLDEVVPWPPVQNHPQEIVGTHLHPPLFEEFECRHS